MWMSFRGKWKWAGHKDGDSKMTPLLESAIKKVNALDDADQDSIAAIILDELEDERRWGAAFARSQDKLAKLTAATKKKSPA